MAEQSAVFELIVYFQTELSLSPALDTNGKWDIEEIHPMTDIQRLLLVPYQRTLLGAEFVGIAQAQGNVNDSDM